jgi:hypothetical protein
VRRSSGRPNRIRAAGCDCSPRRATCSKSLAQADGRRIAQLLLERCPARDRCRAEVLITAGILAMVTANAQASRAFHSESQRLSAELGERELEAFATFYRGLTDTLHMAVEPARADLEAARALHRRAHSRPGEAWRSPRSA